MNTDAWLNGFAAGTLRKLGVAPNGMDPRTWLAGYFEGVDPPEIYFVDREGSSFHIKRFDAKEGEPYPVEEGSFRSRRQAEEFLALVGRLMKSGSAPQIEQGTQEGFRAYP